MKFKNIPYYLNVGVLIIIFFSFRAQGQTLPSFMKDLGLRTTLIKSTTNPNIKLLFSGNYIYKTDTNFNIISSIYLQVPGTPGASGSWSAYTENDSISAAIFDYAYVTPWVSVIGNLICLVNRNTGDTIRTIHQNEYRTHYVDFNKDTLIIFNKNISSNNSFFIKKISTTGQVYSNTSTPYIANSIGKFTLFHQKNSIYLYSLSQFNSNSTEINVKRLDLSGNLIQSDSFNISFLKNSSSIDIASIVSNENAHIIQLKRNDNSVTAPFDYYLFASDTLGNKLWEKTIAGKYSSRTQILLSEISDSTFMTYGCKSGDSIWTYFMQKHYLSSGMVIDSVIGKLVHKPKELTSISFLSNLIRNNSGFDLVISYRNVLEKYSQYPISLITNFSFDDNLNETSRHTIRLNGYWLYGVWNAKYDTQNRITFMGEHSPSLATNNTTYLASYDFTSDYEYTYYTLGIDQDQINSSRVLYPNPAFNTLSIQSSFEYDSYRIYNLLGEMQLQGSILDLIDISMLSSGIYIVQLNNNSMTTNIKFIKE